MSNTVKNFMESLVATLCVTGLFVLSTHASLVLGGWAIFIASAILFAVLYGASNP